MTTITAGGSAHHDEASEEHEHPADSYYWGVFGALALLTALEVSTYWWPEGWHKVTHIALIVMMVIKFATVGAVFMHLRNDAKILRQIFVFGVIVAIGVYIAALGSMLFFYDSGNSEINYVPRHHPMPPPATDPPPVIAPTHGE
ncbi:MAG: cytochrome C oxidase subunit IV family protein [Microthrixaceae bacterium]